MLKDWLKDTFTAHTGNIERPIYGLSAQLTSCKLWTTLLYKGILVDFNLDLNKKENANYAKRSYFNLMNNILGHHDLNQLIIEDT